MSKIKEIHANFMREITELIDVIFDNEAQLSIMVRQESKLICCEAYIIGDFGYKLANSIIQCLINMQDKGYYIDFKLTQGLLKIYKYVKL